MIRFSISGEYLDLPADFSLQFKKTNLFFAFDKMACERSTSFDIPATPHNDSIFDLARWVQTQGTGMRRRYDAQMQAGMVTKDGYLYVDSYSSGKYKAIFVTGELLGLKRLRDMGKISDTGIFDNYPDTVPALTGSTGAVTAQGAAGTLWENVYYHTDGDIYPSINIAQLLADMGVTDLYNFIRDANLRWIPQPPKPIQDEQVTYIIDWQNSSPGTYHPVGWEPEIVSMIDIDNATSVPNQVFIKQAFLDEVRVLIKYDNSGTWYCGYIVEEMARYNLTLTFNSGISNDYFLGYFLPGAEPTGGYANLSDFIFLGGWEFDAAGVETGTPLAGRSVDIPAGTYFALIRKSWYVNNVGWQILQGANFVWGNLSMQFSDWGSNPPAVWRLKDNLPDCTVVDLLKTVAALTGTVLYYTETEGVILEWLLLDGAKFDLTGKVISKSDISRKFADYAQHNYIDFAEDDTQYAYEIERSDYPIDNDNLESANVLQTLPAGNGGIYEDRGAYKILYIGAEPGADILGYYDTSEPQYLCRVKLQTNDDLQSLCDASTSVTIRARLSLLEYEQVQPRTRIYYDGVLYVWTEAQYSKGVATLKLSKIPA